MAFNEIQMWANIINGQDIEQMRYDLACKKSIAKSSLLESKAFTSTKQTELNPEDYGFRKDELNESLYSKNMVEGSIAIPTKSIKSKFVLEMRTSYPTIGVKPLVSGSNQGIIVEGTYDDLLNVWSVNESGYEFNELQNTQLKESLKTRFDEAFFSEGCDDDANPLDEKVSLEECGFSERIDEYDSDNEFGSLTLDFELTDEDATQGDQFYEKITQDDGLYDVSMTNHNMSGSYERCTFIGKKSDLKEVYAIYNGSSSWSQYKQEVGASADQEFEEQYQTKLHEADCREPISHGLDCVGVKASTANLSEYNGVEMSLCESKQKRLNEGIGGAVGGTILGGIVGGIAGGQFGDPTHAVGNVEYNPKTAGTANIDMNKTSSGGLVKFQGATASQVDPINPNIHSVDIQGNNNELAFKINGRTVDKVSKSTASAFTSPVSPINATLASGGITPPSNTHIDVSLKGNDKTVPTSSGFGIHRIANKELGGDVIKQAITDPESLKTGSGSIVHFNKNGSASHIAGTWDVGKKHLNAKGQFGIGKFSGIKLNAKNAGIGAGAGAIGGGILGHYATKDDDEERVEENEELKEAEEFFGLNEDESTKSLEAKPFRISWVDADGKVHTSNVAATDASQAKSTIASKHDGCDIKNVEDLSNVYKQWQKEEMYESMMVEANLADALSQQDLDKLDGLEAKLSDDGMTADQRRAQQEEIQANSRKSTIEAAAIESMDTPYQGMNKEQIGQELTRRHGFVGNELQLFWKVMGILGYTPEDISNMRDDEVVDAITMHIPKGRKPRFQGYIDPMIKNRGFLDDGGGRLDQPGKTGDWKTFQDGITPIEYSPAELDMMHNDQDIDDRRQQQSSINRLDRQIKAQEQQRAIEDATPRRGQDTWLTTEVEKWIKSMPRPEARKLIKSIIEDIKRENGITDKFITDKTDVPDEVKERCAQDILFLKTYFGKHVGMGPTLRDYPVAWGKDANGEYVSHTTAGQYNDETDLMIRRCMATTMGQPFIDADEYDSTLKQIMSDDDLKVKFIEEIMKFQKKRAYGSRSLDKKHSNEGGQEEQV